MTRKSSLSPAQRRALVRHPAGWVASGLGSGLSPLMPGTAGSLAALLPWWFLWRPLPMPAYLGMLGVTFVIGIWACAVSGRRLGVADHGALVWDEFVGQWLALLPVLAAPWWVMIPGFVLFRLFDIAKPWPIGWLDRRIGGGTGVMLDDVAAGLAAAIVMTILRWLIL